MVSGFVTSPCDQLRITSGDASRMRIWLKFSLRRWSRSSKRPKPMRVVAAFSVACRSVSWIISALPWARSAASHLEASIRMAVEKGKARSGRLLELDFETQALELLHQHVEGLRRPGLGRVLALHDRLVDARPPAHVVALHRQQLLERVGRAVGFERPHLHLAEALAAELRLAAQRLLGHERVRARRARVDLVIHEVRELEHVQVAHRDALVEGIAVAAVAQLHLAVLRQAG